MTAKGALRIAFFMPDLSGGGVERMRLLLLPALAAEGHEVFLIVQRKHGALAGEIPAGIQLVDLDRARTLHAVRPLAAWLRAHTPDVLVSSLGHNNIAALCACAMAGSATRVVICQHNALSGERHRGGSYWMLPWLYRALARRADAFVAVSAGVAEDLVRVAGVKRDAITVIHNPAGDPVVCDRSVPPPHEWLSDADIPVFVFAGRLVAQKDPVLLLEAFARRRRRGPARLLVLGEGPLQHALQARAEVLGVSQDVAFCGFVAQPSAWIGNATALVLCSRYEGFGNVIVEALACGTPVIATDCPHGPSEILQQGKFGKLVPVGDVNALAAAMQGNPRREFSAPMLQARAAEFTLAACVQRYMDLFRGIGAGQHGRAFGMNFSWRSAADIAADICGAAPIRTRLVVTPNIDHIRLLRRPGFARAYEAADIVCADGFPVALYAWLRRAAPPRRVTGCEIFHQVAARAMRTGRRVMVVAESAATTTSLTDWAGRRGAASLWKVVQAAPNLMASPEGQAILIRQAWAFQPDILVLSLGAPGSEEFAGAHRAELPPCWILCVGQAVRVELGLTQRAPAKLQRAGLEWAWRLAHEPRRLAGRYAVSVAWFPIAVIADLANVR